MSTFSQNQIEKAKLEIVEFFRARKIHRNIAIIVSIVIIIATTIVTTFSLMDSKYGILTEALSIMGGTIIITLLLFVIYALASEVHGISKSPDYLSKNEQKIRDMLTRPLFLRYADADKIEGIYQHYFEEPSKKQIEIHKVTDSGVQTSTLPIAGAISRKNTSIDKADISLHDHNKVRQFLLAAINKGDIEFGIEDTIRKPPQLDEFNRLVKNIESYMELDDKKKADAIKKINQIAIDQFLKNLQNIRRYILMEGEFHITKKDGKWTCTYVHPINKVTNNTKVKIVMTLGIDGIGENDKFFQHNSEARMVVYGQVNQPISITAQQWIIELSPIAIF